jgi:hypothetical protein
MPSAESVSHEDLVLCACKDREYKTRDVIDAALWRSDLAQPWTLFLTRLEAEKQADESELDMDDDEIDAAAEAFRYERDLITAEETEQWLAARGLTLDDFSDYFGRRYWGMKLEGEVTAPDTPYPATSEELRRLFAAELIFSGDIDSLTTQLAWRLAAACDKSQTDAEALADEREQFLERHGIEAADLESWLAQLGRDTTWLSEMEAMEVAYQRRLDDVLVPHALKNELVTLRLPLTRFEIEVIELESRDAAREALFCVREDGMSMEEVAAESRYPFRVVNLLLEDLTPELQQVFVSVSPGEVLPPMPRGDGFELCRVINKIEPNAEDDSVKQRVEQRLLDRHFTDLSAKYVERRLGAIVASE